MAVKKVCIMGGGNGGFAAAADLTMRGFEVTLYEDPRFAASIADIAESKTINLQEKGKPLGTFTLRKVTTDMADALSDVDLIMPISPAFAQETVAKNLVPFLKEGMIIFLCPGSCGGGLVYGKIFHDAGVYNKVKICEISTLPYATRKMDGNTVNILLRTPELWFSAFPAKYNQELFELVDPLFAGITPMTDVLETALNNGNIDSHPTPVVLNAGKIGHIEHTRAQMEKGEADQYGEFDHLSKDHYHYRHGISPEVAKVVEKVSRERMALCEALGYKPIHILERLVRTGYCPKTDDLSPEQLYTAYRRSQGIFMDISGPNSLSGRYLTEDAPCSLVFCANLAKVLGVATPLMDSVTNLASALRSEDYWVTGRTLEKVGLAGMTGEEMKKFVMEGYQA